MGWETLGPDSIDFITRSPIPINCKRMRSIFRACHRFFRGRGIFGADRDYLK
jgi:hypothetical protein